MVLMKLVSENTFSSIYLRRTTATFQAVALKKCLFSAAGFGCYGVYITPSAIPQMGDW